MPSSKDYSLENLPEGLRAQFHSVEQRLWRVETATAVFRIVASLLLSWLLLFVSDRLWDTTHAVRSAIFFCGLLGAVTGAILWARHWVWQRRDLPALAALVQKKYRRLGDRLLGIVELANEKNHPAHFSPQLYRAAIQQVAQDAEKFDFLQSVNPAPAKRLGCTAGAFAIILLALCVVLPQAGANAFLRWIAPWANIERHTLVALAGFPTQLIVAHGEPFEISGTVNYRSFWKPTHASSHLGPVTALETPVQSGQVKLQIPGQVEKGVLEVRVGDALARVQILPSHRPSLQQLAALVHLPDYLQYPDLTEAVQNGNLQALEGSTISFQGTVSQPLASASMQTAGKPAALQVQGQAFSSVPADLAGVGELVFTWQDKAGLTNTAPWRLAVQREPDAPPVPSLPDLPRSISILASDVLSVHTEAVDDFGVRDLGLAWNVNSEAGDVPTTTTEVKFEMTNAQQKQTEKTFVWSPSLYGIPMDTTVELQAFAIDYLPGRKRSHSPSTLVRILSPAEHAEMLRKDMEAIMAQLEDVARLQEKIVSDLHNAQETAKNQTNAAQAAQLNQSKEDQLNNARQLDNLSKQAQNTVREAMKNPTIPEDTVREFSKTAEQWQQLSQQKMPEAAKSMQAAAQDAQAQDQPNSPSSSSPSQSSSARATHASQQQKDTDQAAKQAQDIAEALGKTQQKGNEDLDQLQALTLAERLRKVGTQEMGLSGQLTTNLADTIGLPARDLSDKLKKINAAFVKDQDGARDESASLQGEISRFFERTQKTNYGHVSQEMKTTQATNELDRMGNLIRNNITVSASSDLTNWSHRFQAWADELRPKSGGGGGGGGGQGLDLTKQLIQLLRMREAESNLRDQTGVLEAGKAAAPDYNGQTMMLSVSQMEMALQLKIIHNSIPISQFDKPFEQVGDSMSQTELLLGKPQTDSETDVSEGKSVDGLSDLINLINEVTQTSQGSGKQPSDASSEDMAFLTGLMKQSSKLVKAPPSKSMSGGGNMAGGSTDRDGHPVTGGNVSGTAAGSRNVHKAAAGALENYPVEFRDALDNYFHAVDNSKN
jgi:hypothetical protein